MNVVACVAGVTGVFWSTATKFEGLFPKKYRCRHQEHQEVDAPTRKVDKEPRVGLRVGLRVRGAFFDVDVSMLTCRC